MICRMATREIVYRVFVSSPMDLKEERQKIKQEIEKIKITGCRFEAILWEDEIPSILTDDAQEEINVSLKESDILIGLFRGRFGSKTNRADSGTVEEIEQYINQKRPTIMYFLNFSLSSNGVNQYDLQELQKILSFKEKYKKAGIFHEVENVEQIISKWLKKDLEGNLKKMNKITFSGSNATLQTVLDEEIQTHTGKEWYEDSISKNINQYLVENQIGYDYIENLTFHENLLLAYGACDSFMTSSIESILKQARVVSFNKKYGHYEYSYDLRSKYDNWCDELAKLIEKNFAKHHKIDVLDVGGNSGFELKEIFKNVNIKCNFAIIDISNEAIAVGKKQYNDIDFYQANMEEEYPLNKKFDICLCLRSIQSRGVFRQDALIQMSKCVKVGGMLCVSIPNGYINAKGNVIRGLYDHRTKTVLRERPFILVNKIASKLPDYNFTEISILSLPTEILVYARKE